MIKDGIKIRNRKLISVIAVIVVCFVTILWVNLKSSVTTYKSKEDHIILIDPGHGGLDGGASSKDGTTEKNINLNIGLLLGANLKSQGYKVEFTRTDDTGLYTEGKSVREKKYEDLNNRVKLKQESGCDVFISIHLNTFPQSSCKGAQVWYSNFEGSSKLAEIVQDTLKMRLDPENKRKSKAAGSQYKVLRGNDTMAGIIVECGFLSNSQECEKLKTEDYQRKVADALAESVSIYLESGEN